jgi:hypothetical protein
MTKLLAHQAKDSLLTLLDDNSNGLFNVIGCKPTSFHENQSLIPIVIATVSEGDFLEKGNVRNQSHCQHECQIRIRIIASSEAGIDLTIINNENSTSEQILDAIYRSTKAEINARNLLEETLCSVYNIVNDVKYYNLGMAEGTITKKKIGKYQFPEKLDTGSLVTVSGIIFLNITTNEKITGITPVLSESPSSNGEVDIYSDTKQDEFGTTRIVV